MILTRKTTLPVMSLAAPALVALCCLNTGSTNAAGGGAWRTGIFAITEGQTARINAANVFDPDTIYVQMKFIDGAGRVVAWSKTQELRPGQATLFDHSFDTPENQRFELRAEAFASTRINDKPKATGVLFSAEVFDTATGKTTITPIFEECSCKER